MQHVKLIYEYRTLRAGLLDTVHGGCGVRTPPTLTWSLKLLAENMLNKSIQEERHSALEDTMATQSVIIYCAKNRFQYCTSSFPVLNLHKDL
ncbi:Exonuclease RNase T/DNA polymerase III [Penicillium cf. viridicatum]|uniref:Exonuclease RNase T/DNA polymerase III n=1 Tax=Penicillium cf. viridicatum TaxID=2972119 RepID=A0A9W9M2T2_9EURO|nr:Exonuclease RNase T/DNA polymerase III [Penicillium cf. viridicatum]